MVHNRGWWGFVASVVLLSVVLWGALVPVASANQPAATPTPGASTEGVYIVKAGDTLYSIAKKHGVTVDDLQAWNNIPDPSRIKVGQKIAIKASSVGAAVVEPQDEDASISFTGKSTSWSASVRTIVIFGAIFLVLIVLLSIVDRIRR
jgi:hypothetical protein